MKCASCGMPLSPTRTNAPCPRCGALTGSEHKSTATATQLQYEQSHRGGGSVPLGVGAPPQSDIWQQGALYPPYTPPVAEAPGPQQGSIQGAPLSPPQVEQYSQPAHTSFNPQQGFPYAVPPKPQSNRRNSKFGFLVAGLCVVTGGLLLVFVYLMAIGLPGGPANSSGTTTTQSRSSPTAASSPASTPSPAASVYAGQQYINNAQMASAIDTHSSQPTHLATTFKTNQTIYVTFQLHTGGKSGFVCTNWYLNGKRIISFAFPVGASYRMSYAQTSYQYAGSAYVELYWASSTQCTDEVLAQHVDFTVTS